MTEAHHIEETQPAGPVELCWSDLWMLPLILMQLICGLFGRHLVKLKQMRRSRPLPANWQDHLEGLREAEWPILVILAEGARQILQGKPLDLCAIACPEQPQTFQPAFPRNARSVHLRMENLARFHADPERYVRRHADRIRERERDEIDSGIPIPTILPSDDSGIPIRTTILEPRFRRRFSAPLDRRRRFGFRSDVPVAVAIRGPPWLIPPAAQCRLPRGKTSARP